jgi:diguanylate cyclase (GGDEF)-like protein/PAS domain S-box-containing protein
MGSAARRRRRTCLAAGASAGALVFAAWLALAIGPPATGMAEFGDVLHLVAVLPAGIALFLLAGAPELPAGRGRTVVDGMIVATALLALAWVCGLDDRYQTAAGDGFGVVALHVLGFVAVTSMCVVMLTRAAPDARRTLALWAIGLGTVTVADAFLLWLRLEPGYEGTSVPMLLAVAGLGVLVVASRTPSGSSPGLPTRASVYIPSVPLVVGLVAITAEGVGTGHLSDFLICIGVGLVVLVIARQIFALLENIAFWRDLEATIAVQTDELTRSEARFRSLVQNSSDVITVIGVDGDVRYQSPSVTRVFGHAPERLEEEGLAALVDAEDLPVVHRALREIEPGATRTLQCGVTHADGRRRRVEITASNLLEDADVGGYVLNIRDDTERRALEDQLTHMAFHDPLTDLANRALFQDRVKHAIARRRTNSAVAALFIDLDDFKNVNDSLGHGIGDELLVLVGERLRGGLRPGDTVGRLGGDEFAVLLEDIHDEVEPVRAAERILASLSEPFRLGGRTLHTRASIGIATVSVGGENAGDLLRNADTAMYTAKSQGKGRYVRFDGDMHGLVARRMELEGDLRRALDGDELRVAYQPIHSLRTRCLTGFEALARWDHPVHGPIRPDEFIKVAEESGLILPLGQWVLSTATQQLRRWQKRVPGGEALEISVNVSARQLRQPEFGDQVAEAVLLAGLDPACLVLELTESLLMDDIEPTIAKLERIRRYGTKVAIDDFGTGYSSLSYLLRLPVDKLKVDRSFVNAMGEGTNESALVQAIVTMGHVLGLEIVAEGVETEEQEQALVAAGCDLGQGYLLGRPVAPHEIERLLSAPAVVGKMSSSD